MLVRNHLIITTEHWQKVKNFSVMIEMINIIYYFVVYEAVLHKSNFDFDNSSMIKLMIQEQ